LKREAEVEFWEGFVGTQATPTDSEHKQRVPNGTLTFHSENGELSIDSESVSSLKRIVPRIGAFELIDG